MNALKSLVTSLSSSKAGLAATAGGAVRGPPSAGAVASRTRSYWTIPIRRWLVGTSCGGIHTTKPYASSLCVTTSIMRPFSSTTSVWNRWNGAHGSVGDNHHRLLGATAHQPSWGCSPPPHTHHHQFQQFREMSKYLSKAAKTRLPLTTKRARKGYYKGKGATKEGHLTSTGKFVVDPLKRLQLVVPDLSDFKVRTQYVVCVCVCAANNSSSGHLPVWRVGWTTFYMCGRWTFPRALLFSHTCTFTTLFVSSFLVCRSSNRTLPQRYHDIPPKNNTIPCHAKIKAKDWFFSPVAAAILSRT